MDKSSTAVTLPARACNACRGSGRQPTEWGYFAPKSWGPCRHCHGSGLEPDGASETKGQPAAIALTALSQLTGPIPTDETAPTERKP